MKCDDQILVGIRNIQPLLGNSSEATIIKWKVQYPSMPMVKIGGQWTTYRDEMRLWWRALVTDRLDDYKPGRMPDGECEPRRNDTKPKTKTRKGRKTA